MSELVYWFTVAMLIHLCSLHNTYYINFRCPTKVKITKMNGLGSQQWLEPEIHEFPLPSDIVALSTEDGKETPGFNFVNSQGLAYEAAE